MKILRKIQINASAEAVWQVLGRDFDRADEWMAVVQNSYQKVEGISVAGAPMIGRICELSHKPTGPVADETITFFDDENYRMHMRVSPIQGKVPVVKNEVEISVKSLGPDLAEVSWDADLELKTAGKLLYPALKAGVGKSFMEVLEELKHFLETGKPHPRKLAKLAKAA
ncbi:MAG: SRPBCC family protein [Bacteroidota bacterium]